MAQRVFTLDINGMASVCFNAADAGEAIGLCSLDEVRADLAALTSGGKALCSATSVLSVRTAGVEEIAAFHLATAHTPPADGPVFAFLVAIDGQQVIVPRR